MFTFIHRKISLRFHRLHVRDVFRVEAVRALVYASCVVVITYVVVILQFVEPTSAFLPLHYNIFFGIDLVGSWWQFFFFPLGGVILIVGAIGLSTMFPRRPLTQTILFSYVLCTILTVFAGSLFIFFTSLISYGVS